MNEHQLVFIGGLHRSGTTLLHDCIVAHPEVSGLEKTGVPMNEGQFLQDVYPPANTRRKLWILRYLRGVAPRAVVTRGYGGPGRFGFDPGSFLDETSSLISEATAARIFRSWQPYWDLRRPYLAEKSPPNLVRTRFLQKLFPGCYFIIVYRHPIPVSYATRKWTKYRPLYFLFEHWLRCYQRFEADRPHLRKVLVVRYEDFADAPQGVLQRVHEFLGLPGIPLRREVRNMNHKYLERWQQEGARSWIGSAMEKILIKRFEADFARFGYSLRASARTDGGTSAG